MGDGPKGRMNQKRSTGGTVEKRVENGRSGRSRALARRMDIVNGGRRHCWGRRWAVTGAVDRVVMM